MCFVTVRVYVLLLHHLPMKRGFSVGNLKAVHTYKTGRRLYPDRLATDHFDSDLSRPQPVRLQSIPVRVKSSTVIYTVDGMWEVWRPSRPVTKVRFFFPVTKPSVTKATFCHSTFAVYSLMCWTENRRSVDGMLTACGPSWRATTVRLFPASTRTSTKLTS